MQTGINRYITGPLMRVVLVVQGILLTSYLTVAQETRKLDVDVDIGGGGGAAGGGWYSVWWVWVLVAVFLIVVIALTSRGRSAD